MDTQNLNQSPNRYPQFPEDSGTRKRTIANARYGAQATIFRSNPEAVQWLANRQAAEQARLASRVVETVQQTQPAAEAPAAQDIRQIYATDVAELARQRLEDDANKLINEAYDGKIAS